MNTIQCQGTYNTPSTRILYHTSLAPVQVLFLYSFFVRRRTYTKEGDMMSELRYAYGYIRVSTHDQEEISPDSQENLLREYATRNNIVILKIFSDLGISGRKAEKRPGFQEMFVLAKGSDHPVYLILVWKFSRFARNQEESIVYKSLLKKQHNVEVVSIFKRGGSAR